MLEIQKTGITFKVDEVVPAPALLPECKSYEAVKSLLGSDIESCVDYHGCVVKDVHYHALLAAVYTAFSQHRPLILSPDMIWLTITQGLAQHMAIHAEQLRSNFVRHEGRETLETQMNHFVKGSPENPWMEAFASWSGQIRERIGPDLHDILIGNFSTTGPIERAVSEITLMDIFERYFHYSMVCICGIPELTLEGTVADWRLLRSKIETLAPFDISWWLEHLRPICDEFVLAAGGTVNLSHWKDICKLRKAYGGEIINGWIAKLFPYLREFDNGPVRRKNPIFETNEGFLSTFAPSGLSAVPFTWRVEIPGKPKSRFDMEAIAGFLGFEQNSGTKALRPRVGWAVREVSGIDASIGRLRREHKVFPGARAGNQFRGMSDAGSNIRMLQSEPMDLGQFYFNTNGASLFGEGTRSRFDILPKEKLDSVPLSDGLLDHAELVHFCNLADGTFLAIDFRERQAVTANATKELMVLEKELAPLRDAEMERIQREMDRWKTSHPGKPDQRTISHRFDKMKNESVVLNNIHQKTWSLRSQTYLAWMVIPCRKGSNAIDLHTPVIAESFAEFLELALKYEGRYWWREHGYVGYSNARERLRKW